MAWTKVAAKEPIANSRRVGVMRLASPCGTEIEYTGIPRDSPRSGRFAGATLSGSADPAKRATLRISGNDESGWAAFKY